MSHRAPLFLKRILITREPKQAQSFSEKIKELGGVPVNIPLLAFQRSMDNEAVIKEVLQELSNYHWIVFTSQNGVAFFFELLSHYKIKIDELSKLQIAAVGEKTEKELQKYNLKADLMPEIFVAESLLESMIKRVSRNERVLIVRGNLARPIIKNGLTAKGYDVTDLVTYETIHNEGQLQCLVETLRRNEVDAITFTSSSTVSFFVEAIKDIPDWHSLLNHCIVVCIGPVTGETARKYGIEHLTPTEYTVDGMIEVLVTYFKNQ